MYTLRLQLAVARVGGLSNSLIIVVNMDMDGIEDVLACRVM